MTGDLIINKATPCIKFINPNITIGETPSTSIFGTAIALQDSSSTTYGNVMSEYLDNGRLGIVLQATRNNINHALRLDINDDGNRIVSITEATPWLTALGLNNTRQSALTNGTGTNVSLANNTNVSLATSIQFTAGTYIIHAVGSFASNSSGHRNIHLSTTSNGSTVDRFAEVSCVAISGSETKLNLTTIRTFTSTTTYHLVGWQNSGSALNGTGGIEAIKIH